MLKKQRRFFHSSRMKCLLVKMSAFWCLVSLYLISILGSKLILSNNPSRETLWVLDTCLIVGLLPFTLILITASLSSNTYNTAIDRENLTFEGTLSIWNNSELSCTVEVFVWLFFRVLVMTRCHRFPCADGPLVFIRLVLVAMKYFCNQIPKVQSWDPSIRGPASREIISASVELWETEVCFLHIQLIGTNVWLPKMHKIPPDVDFESSKPPAKSESWNNPNRHCCAVFPTWQHCLNSLVWWMSEITRAKRLSHALVHFVMARASLFTDHTISHLPIPAKYRHFRTIWVHTFDNSTDPISSSLNWWSSIHGVATLYHCWGDVFANSQKLSPHILFAQSTRRNSELRCNWHYSKRSVHFFCSWFVTCLGSLSQVLLVIAKESMCQSVLARFQREESILLQSSHFLACKSVQVWEDRTLYSCFEHIAHF